MIDVDQGERSFTYWREQSAARRLADDPATLQRTIASSDIIYISGITLAILDPQGRRTLLAAFREARADGKMTVFDPNLRPRLWSDRSTMNRVTTEAASTAHLVLPSFEDERLAFGDADLESCARRYLKAGAVEVVVKNAGGPVLVAHSDQTLLIDGLSVVEPIDTTGAGDSFNGAFIAAKLSGRASAEAVRLAHEIASRVVQCHGALADAAMLASRMV